MLRPTKQLIIICHSQSAVSILLPKHSPNIQTKRGLLLWLVGPGWCRLWRSYKDKDLTNSPGKKTPLLSARRVHLVQQTRLCDRVKGQKSPLPFKVAKDGLHSVVVGRRHGADQAFHTVHLIQIVWHFCHKDKVRMLSDLSKTCNITIIKNELAKWLRR